jgi:Holliday junction resolvasome RuvABC endonuclease subunit
MVRILLSLKSVPEPHDAADALAVAICHFHHAGINNRLTAASADLKVNTAVAAASRRRSIR